MLHGSIPLPVQNNLTSADIGVNVQAYSANLDALAASTNLAALVNAGNANFDANLGINGNFSVGGTVNLNGDAFVGGIFQPATFDASVLPTADPEVAGQVWSDGGTLKVSAG